MPSLSTLRTIAFGLLILALGAALFGLKHQTERVGGLETEKTVLETALNGAAEAYGELGEWMVAKDQAAARALAAKTRAQAKTQAIDERINHAKDDDCAGVLAAAVDGLRGQYPDDPGVQTGRDESGRRAADGNPGPADPQPR